MLRAEAKGGVSSPLVEGATSVYRPRRSPVILLAIGFNVSATATFAAAHSLNRSLVVDLVTGWTRYGLASAICAVLFAVDFLIIVRGGRRCSIGAQRQTPKSLIRQFGTRVGPLMWGLDTGLAVTTIRMASVTWAALALALLGLVPWWFGLTYGLSFSVPLIVAVLVPRWRAGAGPAHDPQWIPRQLMRRQRVVQTACTALLLVATLSFGLTTLLNQLSQ